MSYVCSSGHLHPEADTLSTPPSTRHIKLTEVTIDLRETLRVESIGAHLMPPKLAGMLLGKSDHPVVAITGSGFTQVPGTLGFHQTVACWAIRIPEVAHLIVSLERLSATLSDEQSEMLNHEIESARVGLVGAPTEGHDIAGELDIDLEAAREHLKSGLLDLLRNTANKFTPRTGDSPEAPATTHSDDDDPDPGVDADTDTGAETEPDRH